MTSLEYYIEQIEQFISALTDDIESGEGTVVTQTKLAVYREVLEHLEEIEQESSGDLISRERALTAFADYVGSGMSMNDFDALWDIVAKMPAVKQEPNFLAKSDGTIEQIINCNDCLFKKEWEKIGKLLSNILEKHTEQEPCGDAISRQAALDCFTATKLKKFDFILHAREEIKKLAPVNLTKTGHWIEDEYEMEVRCSACGEENDKWSKYCPNCGAKMVEPQEGEEV